MDAKREARLIAINHLTERIISAAIAVHQELGPGLLESAYSACLVHELAQRQLQFQREVTVPIKYKNVTLDCGYRADLIINGAVVVEVKAVKKLDPIFTAQLITYMKVTGCRVGLLINFNVERLIQGIRRFVTD